MNNNAIHDFEWLKPLQTHYIQIEGHITTHRVNNMIATVYGRFIVITGNKNCNSFKSNSNN
jgi:hypothetical protein